MIVLNTSGLAADVDIWNVDDVHDMGTSFFYDFTWNHKYFVAEFQQNIQCVIIYSALCIYWNLFERVLWRIGDKGLS